MATSGSTNFAVTRDDIINEALEMLGVLGEGEIANTNQIASALLSIYKLFVCDSAH